MVRITIFLVVMILIGACQRKNNYQPAIYLSTEDQDERVSSIIRYLARPPEGITMSERFYAAYDEYYKEQQALYSLDAYYVDKSERHYFLVSRTAPSLTKKRVAIGGLIQLNKEGQMVDYQELFRTWKMSPDTLAVRSNFLFDKLVKGENLEPWGTGNSGNTDYIEFPNNDTFFDSATRSWKTK